MSERSRRLTVWMGLLLTLMVLSVPAHAQPTAQEKATARALFIEGDKKFRSGDYNKALKAFKAADDIMGVPTTGLEYGRTLMMLGKLIEAQEKLLEVSRLPTMEDETSAQERARDEAKSLARQVGPRIPSIKVIIDGSPEGASITLKVDDVVVPPTAVEFPQKVNPGEHAVEVRVPGFQPVGRMVKVAERREEKVTIVLKALDGEQPVDPWAGGGTPSGPSSPDGSPDGTSGGLPTLSWIGFGVGAVGVVVGTITGVIAISEQGELEDTCPNTECPPEQADQLDSALVAAHVSTVAFVVGGLGLATGVAGWLFREHLPDSLAGSVQPVVGLGSAGLRGSF